MKKNIIFLTIVITINIYSQDWTQQTSPVSSGLICVSSNLTYFLPAWIGGVSGIILKSTNSGTNWVIIQNPLIGTNTVNCICGLGPNICLVSYTTSSGSYLLKTSNGGSNWFQVFFQSTGDIKSIRPKLTYTWGYQDTLLCFIIGNPVGGRWSLWKSTNGGTNWDSTNRYLPQNNSETGFYNNSVFGNIQYSAGDIFFGTNNSRIYHSQDTGRTWSIGAVNGLSNILSVFPPFAGGQSGVKTTNNGLTWNPVSLPGNGNFVGCFKANYDRYLYGRSTQIYESTNYSPDFTNFQLTYTTSGNIKDMNINSLSFEGTFAWGWAVTDNGNIYHYSHIFADVKKLSYPVPDKFSLFQNYPNPFNPSTKIKFSIPNGVVGQTFLSVYDILGREVATLVNEKLSPGTYEVEWNGNNYASGVYFYKITAGDFSETKKLVLIK